MSDGKSTFVKCTDCTEFVELTRDADGRLKMMCDCGIQRALKVKEVLPDTWQP